MCTHTHAQAYICVCVLQVYLSIQGCSYFTGSILYMRHLLHVCPARERDPSSVALPEVCSFLTGLTQYGKFFLTINEGIRTKDVILCTHCKAL